MLTTMLIVLTINSAQSQLNGEFWWLNKKLNNFRNVQPAEPKIEVLGEFDNDESEKIVFRDNELFTNKLSVNHRSEKQRHYDQTDNKIVWPKYDNDNDNHQVSENMKVIKPNDYNIKTDDEFIFNFPNNEKYVVNIMNSTETIPQVTKKTENNLSGIVSFNDDKDNEVQPICTYITKEKCDQNNGIIYFSKWDQKAHSDQKIVCCILPIQPMSKNDHLSTINFPGATNRKPRHKRENDRNINQKNVLLLHKFSFHPKTPVAPTPRIVTQTEDDYGDPYWNIKNSKFQTQLNHKIVTPSYNYDSSDYGDYASELPRPGLIGLYSDHAKSPTSWSVAGTTYGGIPVPSPDDYEEDDAEDYGFGYSTIDPRGVTKKKGKPVKFTTVSDGVTNAESHTITFQSNPDFQVLQGFKLLNLFRNRSRVYSKISKKSTTERIDDSKEFLGEIPVESSEVGDEFFEEDQLFGECGKAVAIRTKEKGMIRNVGNQLKYSKCVN